MQNRCTTISSSKWIQSFDFEGGKNTWLTTLSHLVSAWLCVCVRARIGESSRKSIITIRLSNRRTTVPNNYGSLKAFSSLAVFCFNSCVFNQRKVGWKMVLAKPCQIRHECVNSEKCVWNMTPNCSFFLEPRTLLVLFILWEEKLWSNAKRSCHSFEQGNAIEKSQSDLRTKHNCDCFTSVIRSQINN